MEDKRIFALRGAVRCLNEKDDVKKQTAALYDELLSKNHLDEDDIVSVIFSVTNDLDAMNPASALRCEGRAGKAALFVTREAFFPGGMERVIRVLIHCYLDAARNPVHVYLNGAEALRPDIAAS